MTYTRKTETKLVLSGDVFANRFKIIEESGRGGMGTVYRALDLQNGEIVALKLLHHDTSNLNAIERFEREAQLLSDLRHPRIVTHIAHGKNLHGQAFLAMEWLQGQDLAQRLAVGPLSLGDTIALARCVAEALSAAHTYGIVHRDIKPSNLFLLDGDINNVKLLDFGIARHLAAQALTKSGVIIGTPEYMSPEQARGNAKITQTSDIFSLGCVLYECITGQPPFTSEHIASVLVRILLEPPEPIETRRAGVPTPLIVLIERMLAKDVSLRIPNANALCLALSELGDLSESAFSSMPSYQRTTKDTFAEQEQSLFSVVLAAPPEVEENPDATLNVQDVLGPNLRSALLGELGELLISAEFLASGSLFVTVPLIGSATDQAARAARAALVIKARWPAACVSMATGQGVVSGRMAVGTVVDAAARPLKHSKELNQRTNGIVLDALSSKLLRDRFVQTPWVDGALLLYEVREDDASRPLLGKPTPCVGREAELANLDGQLESCIDDSEARVMLITAPPGVGKSRLRHEFLRRVGKRGDISILLARGDMLSMGTPYGMLSSAIRQFCSVNSEAALSNQQQQLQQRISLHLPHSERNQVVPFIGELCSIPFSDQDNTVLQGARRDPKMMRDHMRRSIIRWLLAESTAAPLLVILDDLQLGDELTVAVFDAALRDLAATPFFLLGFARPEVHQAFPKLWFSHKIQDIPLKSLSKRACERLIKQVLGDQVSSEDAARAAMESGGNALFLEEIIRSLANGDKQDWPETITAMLQARMGRLSASARRIIRAASIFGDIFWLSGVASILESSELDGEFQAGIQALIAEEFIQGAV